METIIQFITETPENKLAFAGIIIMWRHFVLLHRACESDRKLLWAELKKMKGDIENE